MNFLKLLLYIGLILTIAMTAYATEESENDSNITQTHSHIRYIPHIEENNVSFHGECNISIIINIAMHHIGVYLEKIEVDKSMTTLFSSNNSVTYTPSSYTTFYHNKAKNLFLLFTFDEELSPGWYMLHMKFRGNSTINNVKSLQTSHIAEEGERLWVNIMAVPLVSIPGRNIPCLGNPHTISISVKHNYTLRAFSNMPIKEQYTDDDGMMWTDFNTTPPMSICKVIVALTDFAHAFQDANETINMWCRSHLIWHVKHAESVAKKLREYMAKYASISKELPIINQIVIPGLSQSRLSGLEIILYNESDVTYDDMTDPTYRQMQVAKIVARHILKQWFGGLVVPLNSNYMWLNEGLTSFFEMHFSDKIFPNWRVIDSNVVDTLQGCLSEDTGSTMSPVYRSVYITERVKHTLFDEEFIEFTPYYDKAQAILRMLQHAVRYGFQDGILTYLNTDQFNTATSDKLWSAIQGILRVSVVPSGHFDVKEVMDTWMNQRHYPLVIVTRNYETGKTTVSQVDFRLPDIEFASAKKWWVPITFATKTYPYFFNTIPHGWLSPSNNQIYLETDPEDWIIVNVQQVGYYRVSYDISNWRKIIQYLKSEEYTKIHVLNRAQIIDDAFVLVTRGISLHLFSFFELMSYLSQETDYIAWFPVFRNLAKMSKYFPLPESEYFRSQMADVFDTPLRNVWYEEDTNKDIFTTLKRIKISKWACLVGNVQCKRLATAKLKYYLKDTKKHKPSYWWQNWTYCSGLMAADRTTWDRMMDLYMQKRDKNLLEFLACSEDSDIIINYLNIILSSNSTMQEEDCIFALKHIIIKHARNNQVLNHMLENFESVKPIPIVMPALLEDIISNVYTEAQLEKIKNIVENFMHQRIFTALQPVIESRLIALRTLIESFSAWFIIKEKQA